MPKPFVIPVHNARGVVLLIAFFMVVIHITVTVTGLLVNPQDQWQRQLIILNGLGFGLGLPILSIFGFALHHNIGLGRELRHLVERDRLTAVSTRDHFFKRMEQEPNVFGASLMLDIDHFKQVNDTYGHLAGDAVIARVAAILRSNVRSDDFVCRFGGEEFLIFLRGYNCASAFDVADRMRQAVATETIAYDGEVLTVTVSIGGSLKQRLDDVNEAIKAADEALYCAKTRGRNRTVFSSDPPVTAMVVNH